MDRADSQLGPAGKDRPAVNDALQELLIDKVSVGGNAQRGNREKIVTILLKAWLTVPTELETLRVEGLDLFKRSPQHDHLAIHWGMVIAAYPFWSGVAVQVGRLLRLQGSAAASSSPASSPRTIRRAGDRFQSNPPCAAFLPGLGCASGKRRNWDLHRRYDTCHRQFTTNCLAGRSIPPCTGELLNPT